MAKKIRYNFCIYFFHKLFVIFTLSLLRLLRRLTSGLTSSLTSGRLRRLSLTSCGSSSLLTALNRRFGIHRLHYFLMQKK